MRVLNVFGANVEPVVLGALTLATYWLMLYWMYRKKVFVRI
jgi:predicted acyltransferase